MAFSLSDLRNICKKNTHKHEKFHPFADFDFHSLFSFAASIPYKIYASIGTLGNYLTFVPIFEPKGILKRVCPH